jgi:hypothetical protein
LAEARSDLRATVARSFLRGRSPEIFILLMEELARAREIDRRDRRSS